jgi:Zn-dependent M28 family amino/carboxypeptidase
MIGSINHVYYLADGDGSESGNPGPATSAELEAFFRQDFEEVGEPLLDRPFYGGSDHVGFYLAGIGVADFNAGVGEKKSNAEASLFGGTAGEPYDPCYHQPCDDLSNIDMDVLETITKSVARAVQYFGIEGQGLGSP